MKSRRYRHAAWLAAWAFVFSSLPTLVSGIPPSHLLSSDAEWYVALEAMLADPALLRSDEGFAYAAAVKPGLENTLHLGISRLSSVIGVDLWMATLLASFFTLLLFVGAVYVLGCYTLGDDHLAFIVAGLLVIPVHALAATTLGFQALGFLPRDLALALAILTLVGYFAARRRQSGMWMVFLACGLAANVYVLVFAHLAATLGLAEVLRARRVSRAHVAFAALFAAGALPVVLSSLGAVRQAAPVDVAIMQMRHPYMMIFPLGPALATTLRRVIVYVVVAIALVLTVRRFGSIEEQQRLDPWNDVALAALGVTAAGILIENTTTLWPYHISRTSVFFILAAMMISAIGLQTVGRLTLPRRGRAAGMVMLVALLLFQSNLPSIFRYLRDLHQTREARRDLLEVARWLRVHTLPDDRMLAPTSVDRDLALTLRAYSLRPTYASEKDGGVSMLDGEHGRAWLRRMETLRAALSSGSAAAVFSLMRSGHVAYAVLPSDFAARLTAGEASGIVLRTGAFVVLRRPETTSAASTP